MKSNVFIHVGKTYRDSPRLFEWLFIRHDPCSRPGGERGGFICGYQTIIKARFWIFGLNVFLWERDAQWGRDLGKAVA